MRRILVLAVLAWLGGQLALGGCASTEVVSKGPPDGGTLALEVRLEAPKLSITRKGKASLKVTIPNGGRAAVTLDIPQGTGITAPRAIASPDGVATLEVGVGDVPPQDAVKARVLVEGFDGVGRGDAPLEIDIRGLSGEVDERFGKSGVLRLDFQVAPIMFATKTNIFGVRSAGNKIAVFALGPLGEVDTSFGQGGECRLDQNSPVGVSKVPGESLRVLSFRSGATVAKDCSVVPDPVLPPELAGFDAYMGPAGRVVRFVVPQGANDFTIAIDRSSGPVVWSDPSGSLRQHPDDVSTSLIGWAEALAVDYAFFRSNGPGGAIFRREVTKQGVFTSALRKDFVGDTIAILENGTTAVTQDVPDLLEARGIVDFRYYRGDAAPVLSPLSIAGADGTGGRGIDVAEGSLVVVGTSGPRVALVRFGKNGQPDPTYGEGGIVRVFASDENGGRATPQSIFTDGESAFLMCSVLLGSSNPYRTITKVWL